MFKSKAKFASLLALMLFSTQFLGVQVASADPIPSVPLEQLVKVSAPDGSDLTSNFDMTSSISGSEINLTLTETQTSDSSPQGDVSTFGGVGFIKCSLNMNEPHYSSGAGGAIYKITGNCSKTGIGLASQVSIGMYAKLTLNGNLRASRYGFMVIPTTNVKTTWYVPTTGKNGGRGYGVWKAHATVLSVNPSGLKSGSTMAYTVTKTI